MMATSILALIGLIIMIAFIKDPNPQASNEASDDSTFEILIIGRIFLGLS